MENDYEKKILEQFETPVKIHYNKRKVLFVYQGHKYYKKIETFVYIKWSCYIKSCVGSFKIIIEDKEIFVQKDYNHDFMTSSELRLLFFKQSIFSDSTYTRKTKNDIIYSASSILADAEREQFPKTESLKRNLRRLKSTSGNYSFSNNYDIPDELLVTRSGVKFIHYDNYKLNTKRLIACWSLKNLNEAKLSNIYAAYGTFYACPKPFYQLFMIYYVKNSKFIPFCYFLLPDEKQSTYEIVFSILKSMGGLVSMDNVILDFELTIENALMSSFPKSIGRFCVFHYIHKQFWINADISPQGEISALLFF